MGGGWLLPRLVGVSKACEIIFTGDIFDAREAERIGLVSKVVPAAELMPTAMALAQKIAKKAPLGLAMSKAVIYKGLQTDFATSLEHESECATLGVRTEDHKEAVAAFLEKREPVFKGR
jgi:enoyl-CoA hydratase/carnithine racemase